MQCFAIYCNYTTTWRMGDRWITMMDDQPFMKQRNSSLINNVCFWVRLIKETRKLQSENTQRKVQCMVHENDMKVTVSVCWCPNMLADGIAQLACINMLLYFWHFISLKNSKFSLPYRSINIICCDSPT